MKKFALLVFLFSHTLLAQVCLGPGLQIDESCKCGAKCDSFYDPEYMKVLKNSKIDKKRLNTIMQYQKATGAAYNKLVRNVPLTEGDLANVDKESKALEKWNASSLAQLNGMLGKKGKKKIDLEKSLQEYNNRFMAALTPKMREGLKNPAPARRGAPDLAIGGGASSASDETAASAEAVSDTEPTGGLDVEATVVDSSAEDNANIDAIKDINFKEEDHVIEDQRMSLFTVLSKSYKRMQDDDRLKKYHVDSDEDKAMKEKIQQDIKNLIKKSN